MISEMLRQIIEVNKENGRTVTAIYLPLWMIDKLKAEAAEIANAAAPYSNRPNVQPELGILGRIIGIPIYQTALEFSVISIEA